VLNRAIAYLNTLKEQYKHVEIEAEKKRDETVLSKAQCTLERKWAKKLPPHIHPVIKENKIA
jgi:hypothetical protein